MSATTVPPGVQIPRMRPADSAPADSAPADRHAPVAVSATAPVQTPSRHGRGGRVLFDVPFKSEMSDLDYARLARALDLSTHTYQKQRPDPTGPGVARLDHFSGLYLERGETDGRWVLEARTWGNPAPVSVRGWQLLAVEAATELDPAVEVPECLPVTPAAIIDRPVGEVANRRLAGLRRRLLGLP
ncbi:MAG: hypothetical protein ACRDL8_06040 [Solirubrobacteraceae bacterium]